MILANVSPSDTLRMYRVHYEEDVMDTQSLVGILLILIAVAGMGIESFCFPKMDSATTSMPGIILFSITVPRSVSLFMYSIGVLLLAPTAVALYMPIFASYPKAALIIVSSIYSAMMVIFGFLATMLMNRLLHEFFRISPLFLRMAMTPISRFLSYLVKKFGAFDKFYKRIILSDP